MLRTEVVDLIVKLALREDIGRKDLTTTAIIPQDRHIRATIEARENGILCGIGIAERVLRHVDPDLRFLPVAKDGDMIEPKRELAYIDGSAASILIAERTAINFLQQLSGIATHTHRFVEAVKGTKTEIFDTRKTTPNMRLLEKYAVATGGGKNHRFGLNDQVMVKDNHLRVLKDQSIPDVIQQVRRQVLKTTVIGIEVRNLKELQEALKTKVSYILLDNMTPEMVRQAVTMRDDSRTQIPLEASGNMSLDTVRQYALTGVERISVGEITHSSPWLDISLDING